MVYYSKHQFNKYGANKKVAKDGLRYDSGFEAQIADELALRLRAKDIKAVERQVKIDLRAHGKHICNYFIDFVITHNDGSKEYLEVKGFATDVWKLKWRLLEAQLEAEEPGAVMTVINEQQRRWR